MTLHARPASRTAAFLMCVSVSIAPAAIPSAWIPISRCWSDGSIYMWNSSTKQAYRLYQRQAYDDPNPGHCAMSPDGKRLAFIVKKSGTSYGVMVVNNDGTGLSRVCGTLSSGTGQGFCTICWTDRGLFWTENTRQIYWADPDTKASKALGTLATNTTGNMLRMSRDGSRAYLRTDHEVGAMVGGLFFETNAGLTGIINERPFGASEWDHGSVMLNDGSKCIWVVWNCGAFGNPAGCAYHKLFGVVDFANPSQRSVITPNDGHATDWELDGPGWGPYTSPNSAEHILYNRYGTGGNDGHLFFIMNINTRETIEVTPTQVAAGGPIAAFNPDFDVLGEFWFGDLPNPHSTVPSIALDKSDLLFSDQVAPVAPDTVHVRNTGSGNLTAVSVAKSPAAPWLTVSVGGSGNSQFVRALPSAAGLTSGAYVCTVTVSGGGADNRPVFVVTFSVGARILAPSNLTATHNTGHIDLAWSDNSSNETRFEVQRMPDGGAFTLLANTTANARSYRDTAALQGVVYHYRVRAADGTGASAWSDTATALVPLQPIRVTSPVAGAIWAAGQQVHIRWEALAVQIVQIDVTYDDGDTWVPVTTTGGVSQGSPSWGDFVWTVPQPAQDSVSALIRVGEYQNTTVCGLSATVTVRQSSSAQRAARRMPANGGLAVQQVPDGARFTFAASPGTGVAIGIFDMRGRRVAMLQCSPAANSVTCTSESGLPGGTYLAQLYVAGGSTPMTRGEGVAFLVRGR
jgi:hypothetical protein